LFEAEPEKIKSGGIAIKNFADRAAGNDPNVKIFDKGTEAFFAFAESVSGAAMFGDVAEGDESATAAIDVQKRTGELARAKLAGFGLESELDVPDFFPFA